jgi:UDP-N-acetylmuramyl pentapeptide phosphotransferase/UDP-N-acetylglucosamine-1-phosphate transferase
MPPAQDVPSASLGLALGIVLIALFLGLRQWYERRARDRDLSGADRSHFARQDVRRNLGVAVLLAIAAVVVATTRLAPEVEGKSNPAFAELWLIVLALIVVILWLALLDWLATRAYARRHRLEMIHESFRKVQDNDDRRPEPEHIERPQATQDSPPSDTPRHGERTS